MAGYDLPQRNLADFDYLQPARDAARFTAKAAEASREADAKLTFMREYVLNRAGAVMDTLDSKGACEEAELAWNYIKEASKVDNT